jgi:hypothetical protein
MGRGYNLAVECHLDVDEVISLSLIILKANVSFFYFYLLSHYDRTVMDKTFVGLM